MAITTRTNRVGVTPLADQIAVRLPDAPPGGQPSRAQLAEVAATIAEAFRPERIVLFGSHAYSVPDPDSDAGNGQQLSSEWQP